jgi:hypothetical protein
MYSRWTAYLPYMPSKQVINKFSAVRGFLSAKPDTPLILIAANLSYNGLPTGKSITLGCYLVTKELDCR